MSHMKWAHLDSNQGPTGYEPVALPAELWARKLSLKFYLLTLWKLFVKYQVLVLSSKIRVFLAKNIVLNIYYSDFLRVSSFGFPAYVSIKLFNLRLLVGCLSFLKAFASICLILSRVTAKSCPTSSRV